MIQEDYVSFEIAKLLKDKGFDEICYACYEYFSSNITMYSGWPFEYKGEPVHNSKDIIICPTLQMAMKWLRKIHKLFIQIEISPFDGIFYVNIFKKEDFWISANNDTSMVYTGENIFTKDFNTPEQACEAAIKYCLENLI